MRISDVMRLVLLAAIWGASFLLMRITAPTFGAINTAFVRVLFGSVGLAVIILLLKHHVRFNGKMPVVLLLGIINSGLPFLMYCLAATLLPSGYSAILNATTPLMGAIIGFFCFGEPMTLRKWAGVLLGVIGIVLVTHVGNASATSSLIVGILLCLIATSCYALAGFLTRRWISGHAGLEPLLIAWGSQLGASLFLLPFFLASVAIAPPSGWHSPDVWFSLFSLGMVCTAFAYILYFRLIIDIGPLRSLTVTFLIPPFGILWGYWILGEQISEHFVMGGMIICLAVIMIIDPAVWQPKMSEKS